MRKPITLDDSNFDQIVLQSKTPVLVDFWATWCKPCLAISPIIDELAEEYDGRITVARVDVDQNPKATSRYSIRSIPTLLIFKNGAPAAHIVGLRPKEELKQSLDDALD